MFSGIVEGQGILEKIEPSPKSIRLTVAHRGLGRGVRLGHSIALNGCCLTVVANRRARFEFDVLRETWDRTVLRFARPPERVNLEKSLRLGDTLGGHFVTGHIDGTGRIVTRRRRGADLLIEIEPPRALMRWLVTKGSVAVDGVSLTVASVTARRFGVWLIPHTLKLTTLGWKQVGDSVNLEGDMLAKYAQKALGSPAT